MKSEIQNSLLELRAVYAVDEIHYFSEILTSEGIDMADAAWEDFEKDDFNCESLCDIFTKSNEFIEDLLRHDIPEQHQLFLSYPMDNAKNETDLTSPLFIDVSLEYELGSLSCCGDPYEPALLCSMANENETCLKNKRSNDAHDLSPLQCENFSLEDLPEADSDILSKLEEALRDIKLDTVSPHDVDFVTSS